MKLFAHLNEQYLQNVLDGRRPVRLRQPEEPHAGLGGHNGGPLNYIQIEDLIAFIRAPSTQEYTARTPS